MNDPNKTTNTTALPPSAHPTLKNFPSSWVGRQAHGDGWGGVRERVTAGVWTIEKLLGGQMGHINWQDRLDHIQANDFQSRGIFSIFYPIFSSLSLFDLILISEQLFIICMLFSPFISVICILKITRKKLTIFSRFTECLWQNNGDVSKAGLVYMLIDLGLLVWCIFTPLVAKNLILCLTCGSYQLLNFPDQILAIQIVQCI